MSKTLALVIVLVFLTASCIIVVLPVSGATADENTWVSKAPMHEARSGIGAATVNGKIYVIGGTNANMASLVGGLNRGLVGGFLSLNEQYDLSSDSWVFKKPMPTPRYDFAITVYENKIYCIGGKIGMDNNANQYVLSGVNEVYDPATDTWETKAPMPTRRSGLEANVVNGKIYLIGGQIQSSIFDISLCNLNEVYDPATDSWTTKAAIPIPARDYASAVIGSKIYVLGGFAGSVFNCRQNQIYDTVSDDWNQGVSLPSSALYASGGVTSGAAAPKHIYVFSISGWSGRGTPVSDTQVYNLNNNS
jgi:N-acetylneuraminic acid mutarotase